jgi:hypothetical protein
LIFLESAQQIRKGLDRELGVSGGISQGHKQRMRWATVEATLELCPPVCKRLPRFFWARQLVGKIIAPPGKSIHICQVLPQSTGHEPRSNREVFVMLARYNAAKVFSDGEIHAAWNR